MNSYLPRQANDPGVLSQNFPFSQMVEFSEHSSTSEISYEQVKFYIDREQSKFYGVSFVFCKNSLVPLFRLKFKNINSKQRTIPTFPHSNV